MPWIFRILTYSFPLFSLEDAARTKCDEPSGEPKARAVMADLLKDFHGPVLIGFPSGHTIGAAMTLPFGVSCRVIANSRPRIVIEESAVE